MQITSLVFPYLTGPGSNWNSHWNVKIYNSEYYNVNFDGFTSTGPN
jgi:hypothetical protein